MDKLSSKNFTMHSQANWIWHSDVCISNEWINVRKNFTISNVDSTAKLCIAADTDYVVWINGNLLCGGQFSDFPQEKHYDAIPVGSYLRSGNNCLAILAYYQGKSTSRYRKGKSGLIFAMECHDAMIISDRLCRTRRSPAYQSGEVEMITEQLGYSISFDARKEDAWKDILYDDSTWLDADIITTRDSFCKSLLPRPLPKLNVCEPIDSNIIDIGTLNGASAHKSPDDVWAKSAVEYVKMQLPQILSSNNSEGFNLPLPSKGDRIFVVIDLGKEVFGHLRLELTADDGVSVDVAHGEYLREGRVIFQIGNRKFLDHYVCKKGYQAWMMPVRRIGCRYLELQITNVSTNHPLLLHYAGIEPVVFPIERTGSFECSDPLHNKIYDIAIRTTELCMHEHFVDCPWREQSLYAMDCRNQSLCVYYILGAYDYAGESLQLLGKSVREDFFLELCAPAEIPITIPSFSFIWITAVYEHWLYSGNTNIVNRFYRQIKDMLHRYLGMCDSTGLLSTLKDKKYWNFYEWSKGFDGGGPFTQETEERKDSCLNLLLLEAIDAAIHMGRSSGDDVSLLIEKSHKLRSAIIKQQSFTDSSILPNRLDIQTGLIYSQLPQALAVCVELTDSERLHALRHRLAHDKSLSGLTLGMSLYLYRALLQEPAVYGKFILDDIISKWGFMIKQGCTSFWETLGGADDFDGAGSLCHGWSAIPAYIYQAYVLGVRPLLPGFRHFCVSPVTGALSYAKGDVPTPYGSIHLEWKRYDNNYRIQIKCPSVIKPHFQLPPEWEIVCEYV